MWYEYDQNNSGGSFHLTDDLGVRVWVEARNPDEADGYARSIGIYFDDDYSIDCECCGTRWSEASSWREYSTLEEATRSVFASDRQWRTRWDGTRAGVAHHKDGRVEAVMYPEL